MLRIASEVNYKMNLEIYDAKMIQDTMCDADAPVCKKCYFVIKEKYFHLYKIETENN